MSAPELLQFNNAVDTRTATAAERAAWARQDSTAATTARLKSANSGARSMLAACSAIKVVVARPSANTSSSRILIR